jgi:hypothetical protein
MARFYVSGNRHSSFGKNCSECGAATPPMIDLTHRVLLCRRCCGLHSHSHSYCSIQPLNSSFPPHETRIVSFIMRNNHQNFAGTASEPVGIRGDLSLPNVGSVSLADPGRVLLESPDFLGDPPGPPPKCDNILGDPAAFVDPGIIREQKVPPQSPTGRRIRQFRSASNAVFALPPPDDAEMALYTFT